MNSNIGSQDNLLDNEAPMASSDEGQTFTSVDGLGAQTPEEKRFLLLVERGDVASIKRILDQFRNQPEVLLVDCVDPLGRNALTIAIENENYELIQLLLNEGVRVKDSLLHAIKEEYVEAVELLLEWEETHHLPGTPYSWEAADRDTATFTADITPLILAAHKNNYEVIKILLDRGATIPVPHDVKCGCDTCVTAATEDSLRHSRARINAYRALASPSLICLSSKDPFLTAFELSWELRRLAKAEAEFRAEYNELRAQCQDFATMLLGHARTSLELQTLLNYQKTEQGNDESWEPGERQNLERLKMAIRYKQKKFVAHPSVQQLLAAMWYEGLPGFRRKNLGSQLIDVGKLGLMFPVYSLYYMIAPDSEKGKFLKKPFVKFICHSASYVFFLILLAAASQRLEFVVLEWFGNDWMQEILTEWRRKERGAIPGLVESIIVVYIFGWVWAEIKSLWSDGLIEYISDLWNVVDFITNNFYVAWVALRATAFYCVMRESWEGNEDPYYPRESWDTFDPMLLSEGAFGAAMIFSFLKLVHIFSINPHLGPLQISLGRMIVDILKFFFIYTLVLFAFGCGLNQLLWYYADLERGKCYSLPNNQPDYDTGDSCYIWRRFANLFETSQSLFWASFGLVDLDAFELTGIKGFTRFWGLTMFGSYSVINVIVLLNMLIAMMSSSYQIISERSDTEWKFARSKLWISYFDEGATVPAPFNAIPTFKSLRRLLCCGKNKERRRGAMAKYMHITRLLVRRFVSAEEYRKQEHAGITEDDVNEIRQDISTFRYELIDVLRTNGMRTPNLQPGGVLVSGRKGKVMERRLMKDFQIGVIENAVKEAILNMEGDSEDVFTRIAKAIGGKKNRKDWNALVRKSSVKADPIGTKQTSLKRKNASARRRRMLTENAALFSMDPDQLAEYNPKLKEVSSATRVAYAKFKTKMLMSHINEEVGLGSDIQTPDSTPTHTSQTLTASKKTKSLAFRPLPIEVNSEVDVSDDLDALEVKARVREDLTPRSKINLDEIPILKPIFDAVMSKTASEEIDAIIPAAEKEMLSEVSTSISSTKTSSNETGETATALTEISTSRPEKILTSNDGKEYTIVQLEATPTLTEQTPFTKTRGKIPEQETLATTSRKTSISRSEKEVTIATSGITSSRASVSKSEEGIDGNISSDDNLTKSHEEALSAKRCVGDPEPSKDIESGLGIQSEASGKVSPTPTGKSSVTGQIRTGWI